MWIWCHTNTHMLEKRVCCPWWWSCDLPHQILQSMTWNLTAKSCCWIGHVKIWYGSIMNNTCICLTSWRRSNSGWQSIIHYCGQHSYNFLTFVWFFINCKIYTLSQTTNMFYVTLLFSWLCKRSRIYLYTIPVFLSRIFTNLS